MLSGEATNTNFIVFGLTWPRLEPTIYRIRGEHDNHYTTDVITIFTKYNMLNYIAIDRICGVMVSVLASSVEHHGLETRSGQTKDDKIASPLRTHH